MSKLYDDIPIIDEYYDTEEAALLKLPKTTVTHDLPHAKEASSWITNEWNNMHMEQFFDGKLKNKVTSCIMKPITKKEDNKKYTIGRVTITFIDKFRLSEALKQECWEQLNAQMTDGFGETYDGHQIPNVPDGWCIQF